MEMKQEQVVEEEPVSVESQAEPEVDKASEAATESKEEVKEEPQEEAQQEEPQPEEDQAPPKPSLWMRVKMRRDTVVEGISTKYPRLHNASKYCMEVWDETFPNDR